MRFRYLVGGALLGFATSGFAQGSVTLYGILDTGVEYVSQANSAGKGVVRMPAITGELPSRWGLRGSEDLGGGTVRISTRTWSTGSRTTRRRPAFS